MAAISEHLLKLNSLFAQIQKEFDGLAEELAKQDNSAENVPSLSPDSFHSPASLASASSPSLSSPRPAVLSSSLPASASSLASIPASQRVVSFASQPSSPSQEDEKQQQSKSSYSSSLYRKAKAKVGSLTLSENSIGTRIKNRLKDMTKKRWSVLRSFSSSTYSSSSNYAIYGHSDAVWEVTASPWDPHCFASASADHTALLWFADLLGSTPFAYIGHHGSVNSVRFHPALRLACTASGDKTVHIWKVPTADSIVSSFSSSSAHQYDLPAVSGPLLHHDGIYHSTSNDPDAPNIDEYGSDEAYGGSSSSYHRSHSMDLSQFSEAFMDDDHLHGVDGEDEYDDEYEHHGVLSDEEAVFDEEEADISPETVDYSFSAAAPHLLPTPLIHDSIPISERDPVLGSQLHCGTTADLIQYSSVLLNANHSPPSGSPGKQRMGMNRFNRKNFFRKSKASASASSSAAATVPLSSSHTVIPTPIICRIPLLEIKGHTGPVSAAEWLGIPDQQSFFSSKEQEEDHSLDDFDDPLDEEQDDDDDDDDDGGDGKESRHQDSVGFESDILATASWDRTAKLWTVHGSSSSLPICTLNGHADALTDIRAHPTSPGLLATSSKDNTVRIWDVRLPSCSLTSVMTLKDHSDAVNSAQFTRDGRFVISSSNDRTIKVWDIKQTKSPLVTISCKSGVNRFSISPDGMYIAAPCDKRKVKIFNISSLLSSSGSASSSSSSISIPVHAKAAGHRSMVSGVGWSRDSSVLYSAGMDRSILAFKTVL